MEMFHHPGFRPLRCNPGYPKLAYSLPTRCFEASPPSEGRGLERGGGAAGAVLWLPSAPAHQTPAFGSQPFHPLPNPSPLKGEGLESAFVAGKVCRATGFLSLSPLRGGEVWREGAAPQAPCFGGQAHQHTKRLPSAANPFTLSPTPLPSRERGLKAATSRALTYFVRWLQPVRAGHARDRDASAHLTHRVSCATRRSRIYAALRSGLLESATRRCAFGRSVGFNGLGVAVS